VADGLSQEEAERRLVEVGPNELVERGTNPLLRFLSYFWGPIPWMIEVAALLSALLKHWPDLAIILVLLVANGVVAFWEESQAGDAIAALKARLALRARVRRDGAWRTIPARELVPGDVARLRLGDVVPADMKLCGDGSLEVDQSVLTGESLPVNRSPGEVVYSGSAIKSGESDAVVVATGSATYFGKTAHLVGVSDSPSHFQAAVLKIGNYLILLAALMVASIVVVSVFRGDPLMTSLQFALVLTVAAIPVAMPAVLSVTMAVGARLLAARNAIVSRLAAVEELAGMDLLCSDKTGTLTKNQLTLGEPYAAGGWTDREVLVSAALASRAEDGDPIDAAVLGGLGDSKRIDGFEVTHFVPFDPVGKRTEASVRGPDGEVFRVTKGAPQVILGLTQNRAREASGVEAAVDGFAARGFRSIGVARAPAGGSWEMVGVLPLYDAPRDDSKAIISSARQMGVDVKMITGDQSAIAIETARQLGLGPNIVAAPRMERDDEVYDDQQAAEIERADGFAEVFPEHKYHIVEALQRRGHIIGMTGDGVNDAPALKKADCGIAVAGATDAARGAADMVLTSPGLSVIIDAIRTSREIFQRMNSYAIYRIAETVRVLVFMTLSILIFHFYPVTAMMIVLLALLNDGPILAIAVDRVHPSERPERWNMRTVLGVASLLGGAGVVASFGLFFAATSLFGLDQETIRTLIFLKLAVAGHLTIFLTRTRGPFWSRMPAPSLLWAAVATKVVATVMAVYGLFMAPIGWTWAGAVWGYSLAWFLVNDVIKRAGYRIFDRTDGSSHGSSVE